MSRGLYGDISFDYKKNEQGGHVPTRMCKSYFSARHDVNERMRECVASCVHEIERICSPPFALYSYVHERAITRNYSIYV